MSMGTLCFANPNPGGYDISQYAYYGEYNNIWAFIEKDTYSSMYAHCDSSSVDDMINYVRENGCCNAGVKGEYAGDSAFAASGSFLADE